MTMNIFERAARAKLRFSSTLGPLTTEQLFELPLTYRGNHPSLEAVASVVIKELEGSSKTDSFLNKDSDSSPKAVANRLRLEILQHIRDHKLSVEKAASLKKEKEDSEQVILSALAEKRRKAIEEMSEEELLQKLKDLKG